MKLKYETGIATLVQFIVLAVLNFANGVGSSVHSCTIGGNDCVSNTLLSLLFFLLITAWFGFLWLLGATAQDRRSRAIARVLLAAEALVALVSLFDAHHQSLSFGLFTSLVDAAIAIWVMILAFRLMRAKGGRVRASRARPRQRSSA